MPSLSKSLHLTTKHAQATPACFKAASVGIAEATQCFVVASAGVEAVFRHVAAAGKHAAAVSPDTKALNKLYAATRQIIVAALSPADAELKCT
jgi:hypothetical protein